MMRKPKKMRTSSESLSFLSLPYDVVVNCLARISRIHYPTLSLVSKGFRSLLASPGLEAARALIGKPEKFLYVCLTLNNKPSWFMFSPAPKQKLIPIPSVPNSPCDHPNSSTVVSVGSEIYLTGGYVKGKRRRSRSSRRVFLLDCKSHQWLHLPKMHIPRKEAVVDVIDGKIYVVGGCSSKFFNTEKYGEVYDPKTQTWSLVCSEMGQEIYRRTGVGLCSTVCLVELENGSGFSAASRCIIGLDNGQLRWCRCGGLVMWFKFSGLEKLSSHHLISVTNPGGGRRVIVWWKTYGKDCKTTKIWCAQIQCFPCRPTTSQGIVEWSQNVFTFRGGCESRDPNLKFLLHNALVTHDH